MAETAGLFKAELFTGTPERGWPSWKYSAAARTVAMATATTKAARFTFTFTTIVPTPLEYLTHR